MITVEFKNVGRDKMSWSENVPVLDYGTLVRAVKRRRAILSQHPDFEVNDDGTGAIIAGFRTVGEFTWKNQ